MPPVLEEKNKGTEATRDPDYVAKCVQERDSVEAEHAAREILKAEPTNRLVRDLLDALMQQNIMDAEEAYSVDEGSDADEQFNLEEEGSSEGGSDEGSSDDRNNEDIEAETDVKGRD